MKKEFDMTILFCPKCQQERASLDQFCGKCGTRIKIVDVIVQMDGEKVTAVLVKGQE